MAIKAMFRMDDLTRITDAFIENVHRKALRAFRKSCMEAVSYAKSNRAERYTDQTGALNSSTGFQLYKDGELVEDYFVAAEGGDGSGEADGMAAGRALASNVSKHGAPIVAVLVAGMNYALHVETGRYIKKKDGTTTYVPGQDVLSGAENRFPEILRNNLEIEFSGSGVDFSIGAG